MTYAFTQDVPIDAAFHERIMDGLGTEPPSGLIMHLVSERPEGGLRYLDVWESEDLCDRFVEDRLHPLLSVLLADVFGDDLPPEPDRFPFEVLQVWKP